MKLDTVIRGSRSESISSAQNNTLCNPGNGANTTLNEIYTSIEALKKLDKSVYLLALISYQEGLRVSEALSIRFSKVLYNYKYVLKRLKGSDTTIIDLSFAKELVEYYKTTKQEPFRDLNRYYIYRCYKKVGIVKQYNGKKNVTVTHALRHEYVSNMSKNGVETNLIAKNIGHKNTKNTEIYIHK